MEDIINFDIENIEGNYSWEDKTLNVWINSSGPIEAKPMDENDWFRTDFLALPLCLGPVWVHLGYFIAANRVKKVLKTEIDNANYIVWSGHSMGGSIAEVLAFLTYGEAHNLGGSPPWFFGRGIVNFTSDITWYSHGTDIVPWIPWPFYRHAGRHIHIKSNILNPFKNHYPQRYIEEWNLRP